MSKNKVKAVFSIFDCIKEEAHNGGDKLFIKNRFVCYVKGFQVFFIFKNEMHFQNCLKDITHMKYLFKKTKIDDYRLEDSRTMYKFVGKDLFSGDFIHFISQLLDLKVKQTS